MGQWGGTVEILGGIALNLDFYRGKKVFVTGHTGFKGAWLCYMLAKAGALVTGYALQPPTQPNLFALCGVEGQMVSVIGDVRDFKTLQAVYNQASPEIVFHLAAQPIVRESYVNPRETFDTNVMGTVNLLECIRQHGGAKSVVNVTTDKVYLNNEWAWGYRENDPLDGFDPYSNSKSCSELVTHSYINSFFSDAGIPVSTARAGNVIGGGDFAADRIVPDCIRAVLKGEKIQVRNPHSTRPYQHVLEPLAAYLMIAQRQYETPSFAGYYNIGPDDSDCVTTEKLVDLFCHFWGEGAQWAAKAVKGPHEANFLKLDCSKLRSVFNWQPRWHIEEAIENTVLWVKALNAGQDIEQEMDRQIALFFS
ncbi:CDP-glucose 4,6-dehydratase [Ruminococcaceae bacterium OttesenSCG-928-A16]|nr:CDP-glucose 4,6-dehydratase [Ruminococcaceae bacterium OttesenSCG-928-A16]